MRKQVHLSDVHHWQVKRCVNGDRCEDCLEADAVSQTGIEQLSLDSGDSRQTSNDDRRPLTYISGVDISYVKNDNVNACAACVVIKLPDFDVRILPATQQTAPCGLRGCKNRPAPFPGRMS